MGHARRLTEAREDTMEECKGKYKSYHLVRSYYHSFCIRSTKNCIQDESMRERNKFIHANSNIQTELIKSNIY